MHDDDQQMVAMRELQNPRPQRQLFREINQPAPLLLGKFKSSLLTSICMKLAQILKLDGNFWIGLGNLHRFIKSRLNARAKDLVMSGRMVAADEALRIGLVDRVVPAAEVYDAARELVSRYLTGPALALRAAKAAIDGGLSMDLAAGLAWESQLFAALFATEDKVEGMAAFVDKRKPKFTGR